MPKFLLLRYPGRCVLCEQPMPPGTKAVRWGDQLAHPPCQVSDATKRAINAGTTYAGTPGLYRRKAKRSDGRRA